MKWRPNARRLGGLAWGMILGVLAGPVLASGLDAWLARAEAGDIEAQRHVGAAYYFGESVETDYRKAARWWEQAARQGDAESAFNLATLHRDGKGVEQDLFAAARWLRAARAESEPARRELESFQDRGRLVELDAKAAYAFYRVDAEAGLPGAQRLVGLMLRDGRGVKRDAPAAAAWLEKAAVQGDREAQGALGSLYDEGDGVERDPLRAMLWFKRAAEQGHPGAQFNVGTMLLHGDGVPADPVEGVMWLTLCEDEVYSARYLLYSEQERIGAEVLEKGRALAAARRRAEPAAADAR